MDEFAEHLLVTVEQYLELCPQTRSGGCSQDLGGLGFPEMALVAVGSG